MKIGKATDGLVGNEKNRKPRYYVVVCTDGEYVAIAKVYSTNPNDKKQAEKIEKKLCKMINNFSSNSAVDKRLYTTKKNGALIKHSDLDYETRKFMFDESQSGSIYKFILDDPNNKKR